VTNALRPSLTHPGSLVLGLAVVAAFLAAPLQAQAQQQKPNILFILVDNLGYGELGVYGGGATHGAPTPRIDKLASEGLRLTNMNMEG
jgi:Sulfatase